MAQDAQGNWVPDINTGFSGSFSSNDTSLGNLSQGFNTESSNLGVDLFNPETFFQGTDAFQGANNFGAPNTGGGAEGGMFDNFFSNDKGGAGWGTAAIGAASGVAQTFLGFGQLSEGKKQNRISNQQWQSQFDIQKGEFDRRVSERAARVANSNAARAQANSGG